jgi:hypothetical protein
VIAGGVKFKESHDCEYRHDTGGEDRQRRRQHRLVRRLVLRRGAVRDRVSGRHGAPRIRRPRTRQGVGVGFAMLLCLPIIGLLLVVTIIGIPLACC